jgi:hypothetical protein
MDDNTLRELLFARRDDEWDAGNAGSKAWRLTQEDANQRWLVQLMEG